MLRAGGNAVDAAVTAAAVLAVVEPHMTGVGGDAFAQVWWAGDRTLSGLDGSGRSGSLASAQALAKAGGGAVPVRGAATVTVPGALAAWAALLERYGTLRLGDALAPAIGLAQDGFPVSPIVASEWAVVAPMLAQDGGARSTFLGPDSSAPTAGAWFENPDLARSLELVADEGPGALYGGALGRELIAGLGQRGGLLTLEDLERHEAEWVDPVGTDFMGHRVWELPPAGQGVAVLQMLRLIEALDLPGMGLGSAEYLHHLIEAKKLAFADLEAHVGDPAYMSVPVTELFSDAAVVRRAAAIDPVRASRPGASEFGNGANTVYLAVGDASGNLVSFINSIYWTFGSGVVIPGTGFALQNRGSAFVLQPGHPNMAAPGKRPLHTIIPAVLSKEGEPRMAFGVVGRSMQPQGQVQLLLNRLLWDMDLQEAIDAPRFRHMDGLEVALEPAIGEGVRTELKRRGHVLVPHADVMFGGAQAVERLDRGWAAASDPRRDGCAGGY